MTVKRVKQQEQSPVVSTRTELLEGLCTMCGKRVPYKQYTVKILSDGSEITDSRDDVRLPIEECPKAPPYLTDRRHAFPSLSLR